MDNCSLLRVLVKAKGSVELGVSGPSMSPFLIPGDKVMIAPCADLSVGVLVVFPGERSGEPVLHRVVMIADGEVAVVGDNTCTASAASISQLIGQVTMVRFERNGEWRALSHMVLAEDIARLSRLIALGGDGASSLQSERRKLCVSLRVGLMEQCGD